MYKWNAEDYHKSSSVQLNWGRELISKLRLKGRERVLDIGCGDGKVTAEIEAQVPLGTVVGIDSSREMIALAQKIYPPDQYTNIRFHRMDAANMDFTNEFDVVFSNATLHWIKDHLPVLRGIHRALKPCGRVLLQMGGKGNAIGMIKAVLQAINDGLWSSYFTNMPSPYHFYGPEEYSLWLKEAGLRSNRLELLPKDMTQQGREGLASWIRTTWLPFTQRVPEDLRDEFIMHVVDLFAQEHPLENDGFFHVAMVRLEVEAEKPKLN